MTSSASSKWGNLCYDIREKQLIKLCVSTSRVTSHRDPHSVCGPSGSNLGSHKISITGPTRVFWNYTEQVHSVRGRPWSLDWGSVCIASSSLYPLPL